ncbi:Uma2 family endonuclease [Streptomyces sp. E11-3]|uniref:Uma2 family endonuclease n=1 Tax=Streptomyces sp. E11-3 TaxID=3110112 RepID=UPI003980053D
MTIDTPEEGTFEAMLRTVEELDTPDGYKAELIRGKIVVSPRSKLRDKRPMKLLRQRLEPHAPKGHDVDVAPFLFSFPSTERAYGPDLHIYLVVDMQAEEITAFWDPSPKGYRSQTTVAFGQPVHVPAPFDFDLDTSGFSEADGSE